MDMVPLGSALAAQFWSEEVESAHSLDASVKCLAGEPPPLASTRVSKAFRCQQLLLLQRIYKLPCAPSIAPGADGAVGVVLDRAFGIGGKNWWATATARLRTQRLFRKWDKADDRDTPMVNYAKRMLDASIYALCTRAKFLIGPKTSLTLKSEMDADCPWRMQGKLLHKVKNHDISFEGSIHERFVDADCRYWHIPRAFSLDIASVGGSSSGLYYRLGARHSSGASGMDSKAISRSILPGTYAQGAVSYGKHIDIWKEDENHFGRELRKPYNLLAARPHVSISGIAGAMMNARLDRICDQRKEACTFVAFGSAGFTAQFGLFQRFILDHTKFGARLDMNSERTCCQNRQSVSMAFNLQQQVLGPVRARVDTRHSLQAGKARLQEITYGLDFTLETLGAMKLALWYNPSKSEGMIEIRVFER